MIEPECSMPPTECPEGFDLKVWEAIKDKELEDNFLLFVAGDLKKQNCPISHVCKCLNLELEQNPGDNPDCHEYYRLLSRWRHNIAVEIVQVGNLICTLSPLQCGSLSKLCMDFFKIEGMHGYELSHHAKCGYQISLSKIIFCRGS